MYGNRRVFAPRKRLRDSSQSYSSVPRRFKQRRRVAYPSNLFPLSSRATLKYAESVEFDPSSASPVLQVFSANGLYDPNITGTGTQPLGFDQWMSIYNHYRVSAARMVIICPSQGAPDNIVAVTLSGTASALPPSHIASFAEMPYTTIMNSPSNFQSGQKLVTPWYSIARFFHMNSIVGKDDLAGQATSNPGDGVFFHVNVGGLVGNPPAITLLCTIEYRVEFFEPKTPPES